MPVVPPLPTEAYLDFDHLCEYMQRVAEAVPHLVRLYTIGESFEGRPLLLAEVTNGGTGPADEKPALWLDGNSRAGEVAGSMACLAVLQRLAEGHGRDEWVTALLDTRAFYVLPRMAPDGAEHVLATGEFLLGSRRQDGLGTLRGLVPGDVNGDGRILQMRVEDPRGEWKVSRRDPRLLLRRSPDDRQGPFYRLYREGHVEGHGGGPVHVASVGVDRDLTRNFPGGEDDPLSEPETRAVADFLRAHRNLGAVLSLRSSEGRIAIPADPVGADAALFRQFAARATEITSYPAAAAPAAGDFVDWAYGRLGLLAMAVSLWSLPRAAGLEVSGDDRSETELLAILRWLDRERGGEGFHPWTRFQHPQLGRVEIGGWDLLTTWLNPPPGEDLAEECRRAAELALAMASSLPRLVAAGFREEQVGWADSEDGGEDEDLSLPLPLRKVVLEVANEGYLPTWLTEAGLRAGSTPALAELVLSDGVELLLGSARTHLGPMAGTGTVHASADSDPAWFGGRSEEQRRRLEWLVRGEGDVGVRVQHPRAGVVEALSSGEEAPQAAPAPPPPPAYAARIMAARSAAPPPVAPPPVAPPAPSSPAAARPASPPPPTRPVAPTARPAAPAPPARPTAPAAARPSAPASPPPARPAAPAPGASRPPVPGQPARPPAPRPPAAAEPPLAPPAPASPGYRPAARAAEPPASTAPEEQPRTVYRVTPPAAVPGRGVTPAAAPPVMAEAGFPSREDSPLRKERPPQADATTGRVLGAPPTRPGAAPGRPPAPVPPARPAPAPPVARPPEPEEDLAPLAPPSAPVAAPTRPRTLGAGRPMDSGAMPVAPPAEEDLDEAPPSASRIPAPLLLRRPRQPERKE